MKEQISALMDGELGDSEMQELIRELRNNPAYRDCWEQYHMIGDALRNNLPPGLNRDFVNCVSQAIARESLPLPDVEPVSQKSIKKRHAVMNPVSGFAIAASVAAMAYMGVSMIAVDEQAAVPSMASNTPQQVAPVSAPVASLAQSFSPQSGLRTVDEQQWQTVRPAVESRLNDYLYSHRNVTGSTAMSPAIIPPARLVVIQPSRE